MKTLKQGDFIEYEDLKSYGLYYLGCFAHFYMLTDCNMQYLIFYDPINGEIYSIIKYPHYENRKNTCSPVPKKN